MLNDAVQQRIAVLPLVIIGKVVELCEEYKISVDKFTGGDLFLGYLTGFPYAFDNLSEQLGGAVRKILFDSVFAQNGKEFSLREIRLISNNDHESKVGFGFGAPDGERFFRALTQDKQADDCTDSLTAMFALKVRAAPTMNNLAASPSMDELAARKRALTDRINRFPK